MVIGHLDITSWVGTSIGAIHCYCKLIVEEKDKDIARIELLRPITTSEAKQLNAEFKAQGYLAKHVTPGDLTEGFNTREEAIAAGLNLFKEKYNGILFDGGYASYSPWKRLIHWPSEFEPIVKEMNKIADEFQAIDGYEGTQETLAESLDNRWQKRYDILRKLCNKH